MNATGRVDLLARLRDVTHDLHREVEHAELMQRLIAGRLPATAFHTLQRNLHALYEPLEAALQRHAVRIRADCPDWPESGHLARSRRLAADLDHLHGADWAVALPLVPAAHAYAERLAALDRTAPQKLLAHAYVRYLGDLVGGQMLARRVRAVYALGCTAGTSFFVFGPDDASGRLAGTLRSALQGSRLDASGVEALATEARWSFGQHARMFDELASAVTPPDPRGTR